jgi:hypothetical protein
MAKRTRVTQDRCPRNDELESVLTEVTFQQVLSERPVVIIQFSGTFRLRSGALQPVSSDWPRFSSDNIWLISFQEAHRGAGIGRPDTHTHTKLLVLVGGLNFAHA